MLEGVVSNNTFSVSHLLLMTESLSGRKSIFWMLNGINGSLANLGRAPTLQTKSAFKKQINKCMENVQDLDRI